MPSKPFTDVTMDFVTGLPPCKSGCDMIFTVVCKFSKLCAFYPMHSTASAADVAHVFFDRWVCSHGMPKKILSDRDPKFTSLFWKTLM